MSKIFSFATMVLRGLAHVGVDTQTISRHYTYCYYNEECKYAIAGAQRRSRSLCLEGQERLHKGEGS